MFPVAPCSSPSQAVPPNRYLNVRIIFAWPGLRPGPWGPPGWRSRVPGGPHGAGGHPDSLGVSICAPALNPDPSSRCAPGTAPAPEERRGGVGGRSSAVLFIAQSLRVGASGTKPLPTPMRTHISQKRKKKTSASDLDFPFLTHLPQPQQT